MSGGYDTAVGTLSASILAADLSRLGEQVKLVEAYAEAIHVDIMDGHFVPPIALGTVVVASLVQAEAGTADDAPKVAAVIVNRIKQGTPLQIDATLCYAKGGCPPVPSNADKQLDSPYNTYRVTGLPPTPIMTVTEQSLRAALAPATVPYLFYVTGKDGVTYFATTLAEHEANIKAHGVRGE